MTTPRANPGQPCANWIQRGSPNRVDAAIDNDYDFLLARARQCEQERDKMPNFAAINWHGQGDLIDVVNTLNGVDATQFKAAAETGAGPAGVPWRAWALFDLLLLGLLVLWLLGRNPPASRRTPS